MSNRLEVLKTYKLYIGGSFPRTESGRYFQAKNKNGEVLGNICLSSRKDFRNAVVAAKKAQEPWSGRSAFNIGQIIYRIAENLEGAKAQFADLIAKEKNCTLPKASKEVETTIDLLVYYAGWSDKFQQIFSSVNPVSSSHFNFSMVEPSGVVALICDVDISFSNMVEGIVATIVGGNSLVCLSPTNSSLSAITFAEILNNSDVPGGVVNILTGDKNELISHFSSHMELNALLYIGKDKSAFEKIQIESIDNLKRTHNWTGDQLEKSPYAINQFLEVKTTWHPIEQIGGSAPGY